MKRKQIYRIYDLQGNNVGETSCKDEIKYYRAKGFKIIATGSYITYRNF